MQLGTVEVTGQKATGYAVPDSTAATKLDLSPRETPQSMTIVTRQRLDDQDMTSVRKVLDNQAETITSLIQSVPQLSSYGMVGTQLHVTA